MKIVVLGGCGTVGATAVGDLVSDDTFSEIVVADKNIEKARGLVSKLDSDKLSAVFVDVTDAKSLRKVIEGASLVLNVVGPFYRFAEPITNAVIEEGINCVDICDDYDATMKLLEMDEDAREAGITVLTGMGSSPGLANLLAKFGSSQLDETEEIHIHHVHGGEEDEGAAVVYHRIHSIEGEIPIFKDGKLVKVRSFEKEGIAEIEDVDFYDPIGVVRVYPYPHPETITLPRYIKGLKKVTNKGSILPEAYYIFIRDMVKLGITGREPISVEGQKVVPVEFTVSYILSEREKTYIKMLDGKMGSLKVVVKGKLNGEPHQYHFTATSKGTGMGEGTAIPASIGSHLMANGEIKEKGVFPPEACIDPMTFLDVVKTKESLKKGEPLIFESIDKDGNVTRMEI
ncbi:MAG: Saccharopine dehydrogenase [Candidatus Methanolliviera sp. GoM_oil]|nr:MAG: Saccharopine dehydrogenase [Candidatus Methanolliviera sp. GoM_oil]